MGSTTVQIGPLDATFAGLPCLIWCRHLRSATAGCGSPRPPVDAPRSGCRGGAQLAVAAIEHKGGTTYWARVTLNDATLAYLPDHAVTGATTEPQCRRVRFARQDQTIPFARAAIQTAPKHVSPIAVQRTP